MWDGFNQRKFPRLKLRCEITVQPEGTSKPFVAMTENVGVGGVCVIQDRKLDRFTPCIIRLELEKGEPQIECQGKVMWAIERREPNRHDHKYDTGIEFTDLNPKGHDRIRDFIKQLLSKGFVEIA